MIMQKSAVAMMLAAGVLLAAGCSSSPRINFYTLTTTAARENSPPELLRPSIAIDAVTLPEFVDRPQFVIVDAANRVEIFELHQWAESLKSAIPRIIADNLSRQLGVERVSAYPQQAGNDADYRVAVDFQRFETTADTVSLDALWTVRSTGTKSFTGRSRVREARQDGFDTIAAAYSRALASVSADIAKPLGTHLRDKQ